MANPHLRAFLALAVCFFGNGCVTRVATVAERKASISPYSHTRIGSQQSEEFLLRRTAFLISGDRLTLTPAAVAMPANGSAFNVASRKKYFRCGTASAIDARGYFLTAAHNLEGDAPYLAFYKGGRMQFERSRVVWRGKYRKGEPDLAVLYVSTALEAVFKWAPGAALGETALAAGLDSDHRSTFEMVCLAGPILRLDSDATSPPGGTTIFHRAPVHPGDSGGPLVALDGRLLGVNIELRPTSFLFASAYVSVAQRPSLEWLRGIVAADWLIQQRKGR